MARFIFVVPAAALVLTVAGSSAAQTPQPFPRPGATQAPGEPKVAAPQPAPPPTVQAPAAAAPAPQSQPQSQPQPQPQPQADGVPTAATLGMPIYPGAEFIASYDAGRGQRYYIFGTTGSYADLVAYYRTQLRDKGDQVFEQPATHMFTTARFRDETMAFTPGVTIKDFTWGGSQGYPNPKPGAATARFPTIVMIVPLPAAAAPAAAAVPR
jgi:hypothetical protein